ncbi:PorT family protein [Hymenobacter busanensis]|uniref:PorT family protein n=1 Tax=Hymenobacter busanensis TaxID=2607656 RepID=A0A7L5A289_9BACT|nr:porin family protein [Hymenobacter busanensis]KAA9331390.1 PorT family protein [Hymenobacter busanensis]QHJ08542.1 outer membrane beta-barrel protein [Hymenobacter busanensis]
MKRVFCLLLLTGLLGLGQRAQAQFGVKAGLNAAVLDAQRIDLRTDYQYSFHGGVFYTYNLFGPISLRPEVLYSLQGSEFKNAEQDFTTKLHYVNIPLLLDVRISRLHLQGGPQFGVLVQAEEDGTKLTGYDVNGAEEYGSVSDQITDQYKRSDFSLCAGAELELAAGLRVGGRFTSGLSEISDFKDIRSGNDPRLKNRVVQAYLAFQLGGK